MYNPVVSLVLAVLLPDAPLQLPDANVLVSAGSTVLVALVAGAFALAGTRARHEPAPASTVADVPPSPLEGFSGPVNEFMALVIEDSKAIRLELATNRAETSSLRTELQVLREERSAYQRAMRRYLEYLADEWPGPTTMPPPATEDLGILEATLPRKRATRS